jgi:hypothetical protein
MKLPRWLTLRWKRTYTHLVSADKTACLLRFCKDDEKDALNSQAFCKSPLVKQMMKWRQFIGLPHHPLADW